MSSCDTFRLCSSEIEKYSSTKKESCFRIIRQDVIKHIINNSSVYLSRKSSTSPNNVIPDYLLNQASAIAAVKVFRKYTNYPQNLQKEYPVSGYSFSRMMQKMEDDNPDLSYWGLLGLKGRPISYQPVVDESFIKWLSDESTTILQKTYPAMAAKYREMHREAFGEEDEELLSDRGLEEHIRQLLGASGFKMRKPKIIDAKRCIKYETLQEWFHDPLIKKSLEDIHPLLLFNSDETEINRKACYSGRVAWRGRSQPQLVAKDRSGSHVSLFITINAAGKVIEPTFLLHGKPNQFIPTPSMFDGIKCIRTSNGYMERETFKMIMKDYFIPHVARKKKELETDKRAALVVDGHLSRYDAETFEMLNDAGIDLIILPAHSSHLTQPLDRTLNGLIKRIFQVQFRKGLPSSVLRDVFRLKKYEPAKPVKRPRPCEEAEEQALSPPKKKRLISKVNGQPSDATNQTAGQSSPTKKVRQSAASKKPEKKKDSKPKKLSRAAYDRVHLVYAIQNALAMALTPSNIRSSWDVSGLYLFNGNPPITKKRCENLLQQKYACEGQDVPTKSPGENCFFLTGVVNTPERIEQFKFLLAQRELKPTQYKGKYKHFNSHELIESTVQILSENEDVGDYVIYEPERDQNSSCLFGISQAECYVKKKKVKIGQYSHCIDQRVMKSKPYSCPKHFIFKFSKWIKHH